MESDASEQVVAKLVDRPSAKDFAAMLAQVQHISGVSGRVGGS
ncbi:MAG: hypothetical protein VYA84_06475 [Planctomycetota bacterium]|nr:hypothetical protein [Planctomycetota bacterium]